MRHKIAVEYQFRGSSKINRVIYRGRFRWALRRAVDFAVRMQPECVFTFVRPAKAGERGNA